ncbi:hypothetical protein Patl1_02124 [Pistacia atlantica]|uniref:Uncharacterized protein n=1 Tax=Pistacia atlantica TaxID=434234 RepID=A0ACC1C9N0_9ROSI|nr:hypothetical protein Patl1_02124 [Pistacia atlantica]
MTQHQETLYSRRNEESGNQYIIKNNDRDLDYWRSGVSGKFIESDIFLVISFILSNFTKSSSNIRNILKNCNSSSRCNMTSSSLFNKNNTMLVMSFDGQIQYFSRHNKSASWRLTWSEPRDNCSVFKACGKSAICNTQTGCRCLGGFDPVSPGDFSNGCRRKTPLLCNKSGDGNFSMLEMMKLGKPDTELETTSENGCREKCLKNCCQAYSFETTNITKRDNTRISRCWLWVEDLNNIQEEFTDGGRNIYLRLLPYTEVGANSNSSGGFYNPRMQGTLIALVTMASLTVLACVIAYIYIQKKKANRQGKELWRFTYMTVRGMSEI